QMMHLIQDASVPAHVRNDPHLTLTIGSLTIDDSDSYENWTKDLAGDVLSFMAFLDARPTVRPSADIFKLSVNSTRIDRQKAPSRISTLIDTGQYVATNPDVTTTGLVGIAEYANATFFSKDTNSLADEKVLSKFPYPTRTSVELSAAVSNGRETRRYFSK